MNAQKQPSTLEKQQHPSSTKANNEEPRQRDGTFWTYCTTRA